MIISITQETYKNTVGIYAWLGGHPDLDKQTELIGNWSGKTPIPDIITWLKDRYQGCTIVQYALDEVVK